MATLYIRNGTSSDFICVRSGAYRDLVRLGQQKTGYGNFYVDCGEHAPSRDDQLLVETKQRKVDKLLDTL